MNYRELPYSYMPCLFKLKPIKDCLPLTFTHHSLISKIILLYLPSICKNDRIYELLVPPTCLIHRITSASLRIPLLVIPRFDKITSLSLTWIIPHRGVYCGNDKKCNFDCDYVSTHIRVLKFLQENFNITTKALTVF